VIRDYWIYETIGCIEIIQVNSILTR